MYETRLDYGTVPGADQLARRTSTLTKRISELWSALRSHQNTFVPAAERIRVAVAELAAIFPQVSLLFRLVHNITTQTHAPFLFITICHFFIISKIHYEIKIEDSLG
jgi:hypothetical protein